MRIAVFSSLSLNRIVVSYNVGSYSIFADSTHYGSILPNEFIDISAENNKVKLKIGTTNVGIFSKIVIIQNYTGSSVSLYPNNNSNNIRKYEDDFEFFAKDNYITIVNLVDMNNYLAGVVESEGGGNNNIEYYKVQALLSRTYALKNINRHSKENFYLCDKTHCQVYRSMLRFTPKIRQAVLETDQLVLLDKNNKLVEGFFHANCGGQTVEPHKVWNEKIPYLKSFKDTFCIYSKQAKWEKLIPKNEWINYFENQFNFPVKDSLLVNKLFNFKQIERKEFFIAPEFKIPLKNIRTDFNLKSTFFSTKLVGNDVLVYGRGFGHGVGLCQDGAMKMASYGYNYVQIANYYFKGTHISNLMENQFFKQIAKNEYFE
jgi:stage II sporulation protein D